MEPVYVAVTVLGHACTLMIHAQCCRGGARMASLPLYVNIVAAVALIINIKGPHMERICLGSLITNNL